MTEEKKTESNPPKEIPPTGIPPGGDPPKGVPPTGVPLKGDPPKGMKLVAHRAKKIIGLVYKGLWLLVGLPKTGKSTTASDARGSYVLMLERGGGDRIEGRIHDIANLTEFREALRLVAKDPSVQTIVIDSLDVLSDWFETELAEARGLSSITERKAGIDGFELWGEFRKRFESLISFLKSLDKLVILIAHCREPKMDASGAPIIPAGLNVPGKSASFICAEADVIGHVFRRALGNGTGYYISFQGSLWGVWGSRVEELNDRTIELPRHHPWSAIEACFKSDEKKSQSTKS